MLSGQASMSVTSVLTWGNRLGDVHPEVTGGLRGVILNVLARPGRDGVVSLLLDSVNAINEEADLAGPRPGHTGGLDIGPASAQRAPQVVW